MSSQHPEDSKASTCPSCTVLLRERDGVRDLIRAEIREAMERLADALNRDAIENGFDGSTLTHAIRAEFGKDDAKIIGEPFHSCGAQGYDPMRGDRCPACESAAPPVQPPTFRLSDEHRRELHDVPLLGMDRDDVHEVVAAWSRIIAAWLRREAKSIAPCVEATMMHGIADAIERGEVG